MATAILKDINTLNAHISKVAKAGKSLDEAIQVAVISCMWHILSDRQSTPLKSLIAAMPNGSRLTQLVEYVNRFFLFTSRDAKRPIELVRVDRNGDVTMKKAAMPQWAEFLETAETDLGRYADQSMWYEKGSSGPKRAVDMTKRLEALTAGIKKFLEDDGDDVVAYLADSSTIKALEDLEAQVLQLKQHIESLPKED